MSSPFRLSASIVARRACLSGWRSVGLKAYQGVANISFVIANGVRGHRGRFGMQKQAVIYNGEVGIAIPVDNRLRFIAVRFHVIDLDNLLFDTMPEIRRAIAYHLAATARGTLVLAN